MITGIISTGPISTADIMSSGSIMSGEGMMGEEVAGIVKLDVPRLLEPARRATVTKPWHVC